MAKVEHYIFVDEAGDPGPLFSINPTTGEQSPTGASGFYIISALHLPADKLHRLEHQVAETKNQFGYTKEIKSNEVSLPLYKALLQILNELDVKTYYRLIDKSTYKGVFKVDGKAVLHNVFDEFNVVKAVAFAIRDSDLKNVEVVIDRTDRRLLDGKFDSFNAYLTNKVRKICGGENRVNHITHVNSEYVNAMQMSDLVGGAIRDDFTKKKEELLRTIAPERLIFADGKYERQVRKKERGAPTPGTPLS